MNEAATIGLPPVWGDRVWLARLESSRLYRTILDFLQTAETAIAAVTKESLNEFIRRRRRGLLKFQCKQGLYSVLGDRAKQDKYRNKIEIERQSICDASMFVGFEHLKPGSLSQIMNRCGSDKASGNHNYTLFYEVLFKHDQDRFARVFEIGLGSNNPDVPSNMGVNGVPGASLRGWREYFAKADIFGGDIDTRILFEEDRIRTGFVDQTRADTIDRLLQSFGGHFDLVIDDGLHQFEANRTFFDSSFKWLKNGGLHIIEDVRREQRESYKAFLSQYDAAILDIPYMPNQVDNCLAIVVKS